MYLGQCLQMQSDNNSSEGLKPSLVPFRQCKLTELLFSNSFPSANHVSTTHRNPQKAIMIVTADPVREFNATSQILRYSALAREITVPRIPSVTSIVFGGARPPHSRSVSTTSQDALAAEELIIAAEEIGRLTEDVQDLTAKLELSEQRRQETEISWRDAEERCISIEAEVRQECWQVFEEKLAEERAYWRAAWQEDQDAVEEHFDRKVEIIATGLSAEQIYQDPVDASRVEELENENENLRREIENLRRAALAASPTKKRTTRSSKMMNAPLSPVFNRQASLVVDLTENSFIAEDENEDASKRIVSMMEKVSIEESPTKRVVSSPTKKVRKLTAKKWEEAVMSP
jgi:hypothetical protein